MVVSVFGLISIPRRYVIVRVHLSVSSPLRARGILRVKILNKCILSILVYNLCLDKPRNILYTKQYFHTPLYWLTSWNRNSTFQNNWAGVGCTSDS